MGIPVVPTAYCLGTAAITRQVLVEKCVKVFSAFGSAGRTDRDKRPIEGCKIVQRSAISIAYFIAGSRYVGKGIRGAQKSCLLLRLLPVRQIVN